MEKLEVYIGNKNVSESDTLKTLGVSFDQTLNYMLWEE